MGSGFLTTGAATDTYSVQDLVPQYPADAEYPINPCDAQIQPLTTGGEVINEEVCYYLPAGSDGYPGFVGAGWYTQDSKGNFTKSSKTFVRGHGYLYSAPYAFKYEIPGDEDSEEIPLSTTLQSAGEVKLTAKTVELESDGFWPMSFDRPVEASIQKIVPTFPEDAEYPINPCDAQIQPLTSGGEVINEEVCYYLPADSFDYPGFDGAGWYTQDAKGNFTKSTKLFSAGEGFLYSAPYAFKYEIPGDEDSEEIPLSNYLTFQE